MENTTAPGVLSALKSKLNIGLFAGAFVVTLLIAFLVFRSFTAVQTASASRRVFLKEGYDFRRMHEFNKDLGQPEFGSRLALADLQTSKQQKVSSLITGDLLLLVVVDSACAPCELSKDIMDSLRKTAAELKIAYLPMVLKEFAGDIETQSYAERLGFETCVEWPTKVPLPKFFEGTGTPTHILTTKDGLVLQIWHGTSATEEIRSRIANQISSDLYLIDHTIKAQSFGASKQ
ncbi:MAG TPA: hypothetical protein VFR78_19805 [Pyrinomonadaceae bacterium]|nr:hypothetical protein [Pyrinomonadaceae bacterium]